MPQSQSQPARRIDEIIVHCSATPNGRRVTVDDINEWHRARGYARNLARIGYNQRHLKHIGYHYVIYAEGAVVIGRGESEVGAHCKGRNIRSLGVCLIGTDKFSAPQWQSLSMLITGLRARIPSIARVLGHRDASPDADGDGSVEPREWLKTCPGFDVAAWLRGGMQIPPAHLLETTP